MRSPRPLETPRLHRAVKPRPSRGDFRREAVEDAHALEVPMDTVDVCAEFRGVAEHDRAGSGQVNLDVVDDLAWARAHDEDAVGSPDGLLHAVGDEEYRR